MFVFVVDPALLSLDGNASHSVRQAIAPLAPRLMAPFGALLLLTGIGRVALSGAVSSFADLGSAYVLWAAAALAVVLVVTISGGRYRTRVDALAEEGGKQAQLKALWLRQAVVTAVGILVIIGIMTILGLGLY